MRGKLTRGEAKGCSTQSPVSAHHIRPGPIVSYLFPCSFSPMMHYRCLPSSVSTVAPRFIKRRALFAQIHHIISVRGHDGEGIPSLPRIHTSDGFSLQNYPGFYWSTHSRSNCSETFLIINANAASIGISPLSRLPPTSFTAESYDPSSGPGTCW
jgi:hypothetical protein